MGGNDADESEFRPRRGGMDTRELNIELTKVKERLAAGKNRGDGHDEQIEKLWAFAGRLEDRLRAVEVKIVVIVFGSACGGGVAGSLLSNYFK